MHQYSLKKKVAFSSIALAISLIIAIVLGELAVRWLSKAKYQTPEERRIISLQYEPSIFARNVLPQKEQHIFQGRAGGEERWFINEKGYRGHGFDIKKSEGTTRLIFYGGSGVFDMSQSLQKDWPHKVEALLKENGFPNVEVINSGVPGHASFDSFGKLFSEGHVFQPDYVVLYNAWNDIKYFRLEVPLLRQFKPYKKSDDPRFNYQGRVDRFLSEFSQLYLCLRNRYYTWKLRIGPEGAMRRGELSSEISNSALKQYRLNVEMFVDVARNISAEPVLMTQARLVARNNTPQQRERIKYKYQMLTHDALCEAFEKTDEIIRDVAKKKKVILIDASKHFTGKDRLFHDHVHLTDLGSSELARLTAKRFSAILKEERK